jgi:hypothetical protein
VSISSELKRELATDLLDARRIAALAPSLWTLHERRSGAGVNSAVRLAEYMSLVIDLYDTWNRIEPGHGYDVKGAQWRAKLADIR